MEGLKILDRNSYRGEKLEYWGEWNGMKMGVVLRIKAEDPNFFVLSIVSPFFNVNRELVSRDIIVEMDKIYNFLNRKPGETLCQEKNTDASEHLAAQSGAAS